MSFWVWAAAALAAIASLVVRYRRSRGIERLQLRWVATAACRLLLSFVANGALSPWLGDAGWFLMLFGLLAMAGAVAIALLRYRLYDIDVVINRTLVYGALTATLAGAYVGSVLLLQLVLSPGSDLAIAGFDARGGRAVPPGSHAHPGRRGPALLPAQVRRAAARWSRSPVACATRWPSTRSPWSCALWSRTTMQPTHVSLWVRGR